MNNKMLALYGLKWNPFAPNVPTEALHVTPRLESPNGRRTLVTSTSTSVAVSLFLALLTLQRSQRAWYRSLGLLVSGHDARYIGE